MHLIAGTCLDELGSEPCLYGLKSHNLSSPSLISPCIISQAVIHWLQVLEWTQTILAAGEAFCGSESATLRDALRRQSGRFFAAFHSANLQARTYLSLVQGRLDAAA